MKTVRKLIYGEVWVSILLVGIGFLALFSLFDLIDDLKNVGQKSMFAGVEQVYQLSHSLLYVALLWPSRIYELMPISVLIGTIMVMARMAKTSEFTILRTSGLDPWRALRLLLVLGSVFVVLSFAVGDYLSPVAQRTAQLLKAKYQGRITVGQTGAWLKEKQLYNNYVVNVRALSPANEMQGIRIYEYDNKGLVVSLTEAGAAQFAADQSWTLLKAERTEFLIRPSNDRLNKALETTSLTQTRLDSMRWPTEISAEMVSVALLKPDQMATIDLFNYVQHLKANGQSAQRYEIEFWKKVFYPLSCLVMVILSLPFAYLHFRVGGIATYVFAGVMIGISFFLLNNVFGHIGNLQKWEPWLAAAAPGLLYTGISLTAFGWLVLRR
jgi:lipopolysaccharide export system permease protein